MKMPSLSEGPSHTQQALCFPTKLCFPGAKLYLGLAEEAAHGGRFCVPSVPII